MDIMLGVWFKGPCKQRQLGADLCPTSWPNGFLNIHSERFAPRIDVLGSSQATKRMCFLKAGPSDSPMKGPNQCSWNVRYEEMGFQPVEEFPYGTTKLAKNRRGIHKVSFQKGYLPGSCSIRLPEQIPCNKLRMG